MAIVIGLIVLVLLVCLLLVCRLAGEINQAGQAVERHRTAWVTRDAERRMENLVQDGFRSMLDVARRRQEP